MARDANSVAAAVESLRKSMIEGDRATLNGLVADELVYGHSSARLETKSEFVESLVSGKSGFSKIDLSDQKVKLVDNIALVTHNFAGVRKADGGTMNLMILTTWIDRGGKWQLLARQGTKR